LHCLFLGWLKLFTAGLGRAFIGARKFHENHSLLELLRCHFFGWLVWNDGFGKRAGTRLARTFTLSVAFLPPGGVLVPGDVNVENVQQLLSNFLAQCPGQSEATPCRGTTDHDSSPSLALLQSAVVCG
jgi:hypothetical protein